jgi:hypothetical protein
MDATSRNGDEGIALELLLRDRKNPTATALIMRGAHALPINLRGPYNRVPSVPN